MQLIRGINLAKRWVSNIGIALGFMAATAVGILGGIDAALMFPSAKLALGLIIGGSSCFVNAVSYFYVVSRKDSDNALIIGPKVIYRNTAGSTFFAVAATFFINTTFVANFVGMYIGFTVLGGKLDLLWPKIALQIPGIVFGVSSAVSGLIFNVKVAHTLWNKIRQKAVKDLPISERPLLIQIDDSKEEIYSSTSSLRRQLIHQVSDKKSVSITLAIDDDSDDFSSKLKPEASSIKPTFFSRRNNKMALPITAFEERSYINRHKRTNSM